MIIILIVALTSSSILGYLVAVKCRKKSKKAPQKAERRIEGSSVVREGVILESEGMSLRFRCEIEELGCYTLMRGRTLTERHDYGSFNMSVCMKRYEGVTLFQITHSHILPREITVQTKRAGMILLGEKGYFARLTGGDELYLLVMCAQKSELKDGMLTVTVGQMASIALSDKPITLDKLREMTQRAVSPFRIITPDSALDGFFNDWLWDTISEEGRESFAHAAALSLVKIACGDASCREFVKNSILIAELSPYKRAVAVCLVCRFQECFSDGIFDEAVAGKRLRERIEEYIYTSDNNAESRRSELIRLCALCEWAMLEEDSIQRDRVLGTIEREKELFCITSEEISRAEKILVYEIFSRSSPLAKYVTARGLDSLTDAIASVNPLRGENTPDFLTACIAYYAVVCDILGAKWRAGEWEFSPHLPKDWKRADVRVKGSGKDVDISLVRGVENGVRVGGTVYSGDVAKRAGKAGSKYEIYFK